MEVKKEKKNIELRVHNISWDRRSFLRLFFLFFFLNKTFVFFFQLRGYILSGHYPDLKYLFHQFTCQNWKMNRIQGIDCLKESALEKKCSQLHTFHRNLNFFIWNFCFPLCFHLTKRLHDKCGKTLETRHTLAGWSINSRTFLPVYTLKFNQRL